jgi:tetratricopeptide (TPR) repeat protein
MYGPRALWNQLGINIDGTLPGGANLNAVAPLNGQGALNLPDPPAPAPLAQQPAAAPVVNAGNLLPAAPPVIAAKPIKLRKSNDAARVRALRLLTVADGDFRAQKYVEAASRYRRAAQTAPDLPEAHFRQAQAEIALSHYDKAAKSCKLGLDADPAWIAAGFRLANLYGPNQAAKTAHLEQLAQEATARPQDADLRFLIGIELFLDGQLERSRKFFEQAAALNAGDDAHLLTFLRELDRQAPVANGAAVDL